LYDARSRSKLAKELPGRKPRNSCGVRKKGGRRASAADAQS